MRTRYFLVFPAATLLPTRASQGPCGIAAVAVDLVRQRGAIPPLPLLLHSFLPTTNTPYTVNIPRYAMPKPRLHPLKSIPRCTRLNATCAHTVPPLFPWADFGDVGVEREPTGTHRNRRIVRGCAPLTLLARVLLREDRGAVGPRLAGGDRRRDTRTASVGCGCRGRESRSVLRRRLIPRELVADAQTSSAPWGKVALGSSAVSGDGRAVARERGLVASGDATHLAANVDAEAIGAVRFVRRPEAGGEVRVVAAAVAVSQTT
ncbi:hypothetical protein DFH06DRAFT_294947 [Mycena polygramma]|nr:hypothetical protein DFH06DRAFT_294889 [Mycena polygramma]KAJ7682463.1 hypothetical protein DFH06DRAFT_294920 [Mycena polygramma]KAJ7682465.1 hypothetical protein DFH06DRAFT_294947 [Mycena polygramma]